MKSGLIHCGFIHRSLGSSTTEMEMKIDDDCGFPQLDFGAVHTLFKSSPRFWIAPRGLVLLYGYGRRGPEWRKRWRGRIGGPRWAKRVTTSSGQKIWLISGDRCFMFVFCQLGPPEIQRNMFLGGLLSGETVRNQTEVCYGVFVKLCFHWYLGSGGSGEPKS